MNDNGIIEERIEVACAGRAVEGRLAYDVTLDPTWCCVIAGPHPLLGGELGNNVVRAFAHGFASAGAAVLTFNYSGPADDSDPEDWAKTVSAFWRDSTIPQERDWRDEAGAAVATLGRQCPGLDMVFVGYSFGCWAIAGHTDHAWARAVVFISPNPKRHDFDALSSSSVPRLVVHSDREIDCDISIIESWCERIEPPAHRVAVAGAEHFFRGREMEVVETAVEFLSRQGLDIRRKRNG